MITSETIIKNLKNRIEEIEKEIKLKKIILNELKKVQSGEDLPF